MSMYKTPVNPDELYHYGVMGMHWGIRRYQPYPDGSHKGREVGQAAKVEKRKKKSNAGKIEKRKRLGKAVAKGAAVAGVAAAGAFGAAAGLSNAKRKSNENEYLSQNIKQGKGKADKSPAEVISKETDKSVKEASSSARRMGDMSRKAKQAQKNLEADARVKTMSDDDLRRVINRLNLEKQYKNLTAADIETGWDKAADVLDVVGGITGVAASAAIIASTLYGIKTGRGIKVLK